MGRSVDSIWSGVQSSFGSFILLELLKVLITEGLVSMAAFRNTGVWGACCGLGRSCYSRSQGQ